MAGHPWYRRSGSHPGGPSTTEGAEAEPVTVRLPGPAKAENGMDRALGLRVRSVPRLGQVPGKPPGAGRDFGAGPRLALAKEVPGEGAR